MENKEIKIDMDADELGNLVRQFRAMFPEYANKPEFLAQLAMSAKKYREEQRKTQDGGKAPSMKQMHLWLKKREEVVESTRKEADEWLYNQRTWSSDVISKAISIMENE